MTKPGFEETRKKQMEEINKRTPSEEDTRRHDRTSKKEKRKRIKKYR